MKRENILFKFQFKLYIYIHITRTIFKRKEIEFMTSKLEKGEILNEKKS